MKQKSILALFMLFLCLSAYSKTEKISFERLEPSSWWIGMNDPELQLMVHGENISKATVEFSYEGVTLARKEVTDNPNYVFLYLTIDKNTQPGTFDIVFKNGKKQIGKCCYTLQARRENSATRPSFSSADAVYLLMPDRFANGDASNDAIKGYSQGVNRADLGERHGGDFKGVINNIPYLADLGITALWSTPFFDNNDAQYSYHHYSTGDYYKVDPRLGTKEEYKQLSETCKEHGIKLIIDVVPNHCGGIHWWMDDVPASDWFNVWETHTSSNYRMTAWTDPYASESDLKQLNQGWFSHNMPDFNLANPHLFTYLKQAYVWWIEYANVDGIRVDTYPYTDIHIGAKWIKAIRDEYPTMNIVGECWVKTPQEIAFYQSGNTNRYNFDSHIPSVMDFVLKDVFEFSFNERETWDKGMIRFYNHYAQDFVYPDPSKIMNFLDNHDIDRYSEVVGHDVKKYKMALTLLIASRGYPQIYAGNEIMLGGKRGSYEGHRFDFPGGWAGDARNAFTPEGRTEIENDVFKYLRTLLHYRKNTTALQTGEMKQFIPYDGIYVYFRYDNEKTIMVVTNNNDTYRDVATERFAEILSPFTSGKEITTGAEMDVTKSVKIPGKTVFLIELK
ncbi:MAG: glycoside hydrolase family 13 protein [Paludibacteraceae bacterium]|nr:glycoside hydrolase family 13 protein [Paludibacteraceae bacterium]